MNRSTEIVKKDLSYIHNNSQDELSCLAGKKILITGGAGFLGFYLVQSILDWNGKAADSERISLTVYDNYIRGVPRWLEGFQGDKNIKIVKYDITEPLPQDIDSFQYIIHAASIASPTYYRKYPIETMDANVNGLRSLLEYCRQKKEDAKPVEGFLFFSSSEVYGDPSHEHIPTPETYYGNVSCTGPRACYDESKRYGETLCVNFARKYELPIKIARPFNNYGPGLRITDRRVIPDFARDILAEKDIVILSDGTPTRTFCYVADAIIGYYKILVKGRNGEAYNIGVEKPEISILNLAERMVKIAKDIFGYKGAVVHQPATDPDYLADNPTRRCPKIDKARKELKYNPGIAVDEGLMRSLIWYYDNQDTEEA